MNMDDIIINEIKEHKVSSNKRLSFVTNEQTLTKEPLTNSIEKYKCDKCGKMTCVAVESEKQLLCLGCAEVD